MAFLPRPVTMTMLGIPDATASSTPYWITGLSTSTSISFGWAFVAGKNRVPSPAAGKTALRTIVFTSLLLGAGVGLRRVRLPGLAFARLGSAGLTFCRGGRG